MWLLALVAGAAHARHLFVPGPLPPSTVISSQGISANYAAYPRPAVYALPQPVEPQEPQRSAGALPSGSEAAAVVAVALVAVAGRQVALTVSERAKDPVAHAPRARARPIVAKDPSSLSFAEYLAKRSGRELAETEEGYRSFKGIDQEFDGGDSGGGVVGDGNMDLEDQHNSATLGALRDGIADVTGSSMQSGRGRVKSATDSRVASAGENYFGRSTGLADKILEEASEEDIKLGKIDAVRAQQKENWINQRAIHKRNREMGQGVVYGDDSAVPSSGGYVARDFLGSDAARTGHDDSEISQADLANHLSELATVKAERLDGEEWGQLAATAADAVTETYEVQSSPRSTEVVTISVKNETNAFAPFKCELVYPSHATFSVTPNHGTMNRRSGEPTEIVVRYTPDAPGVVTEATVVFETEDMKKVYRFVGST